jgi:hypothetical protein
MVRRWMMRVLLGSGYELIRIKSWRPFWGPWGIEFPTMLVDRMGMRETVTPIWDRWHFRAMAYRMTGRQPPDAHYNSTL